MRSSEVGWFSCRSGLRPSWWWPTYPIFIRQHDALVEDLLDRAELATTGRVAHPARWPASVRLANAIELLLLVQAGTCRLGAA